MIVRLITAALFALTMALPALASNVTVDVEHGYAIGGTDPVAYFTDGKPVKGSDKFVAEYDGVKWKFASAAHRDAFLANPKKYAPQYGGYCVTGMSFAEKIPVDPTQWDIIKGKLYLNSSAESRKFFMRDKSGTISRADGNWPKIKDTP